MGDVFTPEECLAAVESAEAHADVRGGWSTQRHYAVPTTDIPMFEIPEVLAWFNGALESRLLPMLASLYPGARSNELRVHDAFLVRYDAAAQRELPMHCDQSVWSFTISLNP